MSESKNYQILSSCNICDEDDFTEIFLSKDMPLTGLYVPKDVQSTLKTYDQEFLCCNICGHGQLRNIIDPEILYDETYTHRSSESPISISGNDFFFRYINSNVKDNEYKSLLEVGCNDLILIKQTQHLAEEVTGVDPIWIGKDFQYNKKTNIKGAFINELSKSGDFKNPPDLILSAHTFEHIPYTYDNFKMLCDISAEECRFIIELPCFDTMVNIGRFDQVFHQHLQYISLSSMIHLINRLGCEYIDHKFNYDYWGGTLLFIFDKKKSKQKTSNPNFSKQETSRVLEGFKQFKASLLQAKSFCEMVEEPVYGFGAAQMLPVIAHHMDSDLTFLEGILDDNPDRAGTFLPNISAPIIPTSQAKNIEDSVVMITALDSARSILRRILDLSPRRILNPLNLF